jgi:hypothetical protein
MQNIVSVHIQELPSCLPLLQQIAPQLRLLLSVAEISRSSAARTRSSKKVLEVWQRIMNWRKERRKRRKNKNSGTEMNSCSSNYGIDVLDLQGLEGAKMGNKNAIHHACAPQTMKLQFLKEKNKETFFPAIHTIHENTRKRFYSRFMKS